MSSLLWCVRNVRVIYYYPTYLLWQSGASLQEGANFHQLSRAWEVACQATVVGFVVNQEGDDAVGAQTGLAHCAFDLAPNL